MAMLTKDPDEGALLAAICDAPPSDEPRFAYADWIERHGGPDGAVRADYIRRTVALYRDEYQIEDDTTAQQLAPHRAIWSNGISTLGVAYFHYVRGFVASVLADGSTFVSRGEDIVARCPLQYATITRGAKAVLPQLLQARWMTHVMSLDLGGNELDDDDVVRIAESELSGLRWLNLASNQLGMRSAEALAAATVAGRFPELHTVLLPLDIYDDLEGGVGLSPIQGTVFRPEDGKRLRDTYGELAWLAARPPGLRGDLYA